MNNSFHGLCLWFQFVIVFFTQIIPSFFNGVEIQFPVLLLSDILDNSENKAFLEDSSWCGQVVCFPQVVFTN